MVNVLLFFLLWLWPTPAEAQSFPKPPDVPAYVTVTPTYASGSTLNVIGDGSATGGIPPAQELAEVAPVTESGWTVGTTPQCLAGNDGPNPPGVLCPEAKFRSRVSGDVKFLYDDPVRNYGQPGTSHCHMFFGNLSVNAYSTYASLRQTARSRSVAAGGPLNGTGYWMPCLQKMNPFGDGKNYALRPSESIILYYTNSPSNSIRVTRLPLGLRYVGGYDMDSGGLNASKSTYMQGLVDAANAQPGTSGRYSICNASDCLVYAKWTCDPVGPTTQITSNVLKNEDGSDPFGGQCTTGSDLWIQFQGPTCWDGRNLWSAGGYKHVIPEIYDSVAGDFVCPNGWYKIPALALQIHFAHTGFSDFGDWVLSSDIAAGKTSTPGITAHTDWFNAWDRATLTKWLKNCIGIGNEGGTPRECDGSSISDTEQLITTQAAPTGRPSQTGTTNPGYTTSAAGMNLLPSTSNGPKDIHIHGG